jgi:hypothetical protein
MSKKEYYETKSGEKKVYSPKFFKSTYVTKTGKPVTQYYLATTVKSDKEDAIPFVRIGKDDVEKITKKYGEPEVHVSEKKKNPKKSCQEKYDECLAKKESRKKPKKEEDSEEETEEEEEKPKKKAAKKPKSAKKPKTPKKPKKKATKKA